MVSVDRAAPIRFLRTAYDAGDWIAVFLKTYRTGDVTQRVVPVSAAISPHFQAWLRHRNANGWNVYVSVNSVLPGLHLTDRLRQLYGDSLDTGAQSSNRAFGDPGDFGRVTAFLCSEHARFVTGVALPVDGGAYLGLL